MPYDNKYAQSNQINEKCYNIIYNLYQNVKILHNFFYTESWIRQLGKWNQTGRTSVPVLYSIFLNDIDTYLTCLVDGTNKEININDINNVKDRQVALDNFKSLCDTWTQKNNTSKTKVMILT